jgi:hypothetical protein
MSTLDDYLGLVTSWHSDKPRFMSTLAALVQPLADAQAMLAKLTADFDLDTAIGIQLDMVGQWVGRTRYILQPVTGVFFSFDLPAQRVGFDQGIWLGPYSQTDAVTALDDETYRTLLKLQAIANHWDGTVPSMAGPLETLFPGVVVQDRGDQPAELMAMDVLIPGPHINSLLLAVLRQDYPVKPSGVLVNMIETTVDSEPIFGFDANRDTSNPLSPFGGFDVGSWGIIL